MRFLHCKNWIAFAGLVLIALCCSCEKHSPDELSGESAKAVERESQTGAEPEKASPSVAPTPAEFFPESSPH